VRGRDERVAGQPTKARPGARARHGALERGQPELTVVQFSPAGQKLPSSPQEAARDSQVEPPHLCTPVSYHCAHQSIPL